jgi:NAD(P)H-hydrate epimerase
MKALTKEIIQGILKVRKADCHKGDFGHGLLIAGEIGKIGAAIISAKACLRSGIGLLTVNIPKDERMIVQVGIPEAMVSFREDSKIEPVNYSAIAIGPGIEKSQLSIQWLKHVLNSQNRPTVIDADGINIIAEHTDLLHQLNENTILTPHPKEFDRLFGQCENTEERIAIAKKKAKELSIIIVLKGSQTHIISKEEIIVNTNGNSGLSKGGSGDALTGMILSFLAQGYLPIEASQLAVFLHGLAADLTQESQSHESMLISDVIENIGGAFKNFIV